MELLGDGERTDEELSQLVDFQEPTMGVAILDAVKTGWIQMSIPIGGARIRPPTTFELTDDGRAALER